MPLHPYRLGRTHRMCHIFPPKICSLSDLPVLLQQNLNTSRSFYIFHFSRVTIKLSFPLAQMEPIPYPLSSDFMTTYDVTCLCNRTYFCTYSLNPEHGGKTFLRNVGTLCHNPKYHNLNRHTFHLLGQQNKRFPRSFPTKILYALLVYSLPVMRSTLLKLQLSYQFWVICTNNEIPRFSL